MKKKERVITLKFTNSIKDYVSILLEIRRDYFKKTAKKYLYKNEITDELIDELIILLRDRILSIKTNTDENNNIIDFKTELTGNPGEVIKEVKIIELLNSPLFHLAVRLANNLYLTPGLSNTPIVDKKHTKISLHTISQFYGDNKQLSLFSDEKIDAFKDATGLNLTNRPDSYGVVLNQAQEKVFFGILKAFTNTNYKGDEEIGKDKALEGVYTLNKQTAQELIYKDTAPYKNIDTIPVVKLTQAQIIELSGYDLKSQRQGDKQDVLEALSFLSTNQFCFYWSRLKKENGKPVKDKSGDYVKEEVMEVGTLLRIKTVRDETGLLQYYEIHPSAPVLDQVNNYFLLIPNNWRDEVKRLTGKRASSYTYKLLVWLRREYERIRLYNKGGGKKRKPKPFKISKSWEEVAIALKMPETMYKANRKRASKIIQEAYSIAIKLGYLVKLENNGATDILYLNEDYYPKPGELK
jgi:hypothetical protein